MLIGGHDERAPRSSSRCTRPIDTRVVLGRFQAGDASHANGRGRRGGARVPGLGGDAVAGARRDCCGAPSTLIEDARLLHRRGARARGRQEPDGGARRGAGDRRPHPLLLRRDGGERRLRASAMRAIRSPGSRARTERVEAARRMAGDRAVQFSARARRRSGRRGAGRRQHGRVQAGVGARRGAARLLADALRDAGVPPGVFNRDRARRIAGRGADRDIRTSRARPSPAATRSACTSCARSRRGAGRGRASPRWAARTRRSSRRHANLDDAATGITRSAFGLSGQKCSACSRVYVEHTVFADFVAALHAAARRSPSAIRRGASTGWGRSSTRAAVARFEDAAARVRALGAEGGIVHGGERLDHGDLAHGHYCAPTIARAPLDHPLWQRELFAPFVLVAPVDRSTKRSRARTRASTG